jgi:hypothetical protein
VDFNQLRCDLRLVRGSGYSVASDDPGLTSDA